MKATHGVRGNDGRGFLPATDDFSREMSQKLEVLLRKRGCLTFPAHADKVSILAGRSRSYRGFLP